MASPQTTMGNEDVIGGKRVDRADARPPSDQRCPAQQSERDALGAYRTMPMPSRNRAVRRR